MSEKSPPSQKRGGETPPQNADDETFDLDPHQRALLISLQVQFDLQFIMGQAGLAWENYFYQANVHQCPNLTSEQEIRTAKASMLIKFIKGKRQ